MEKILNFIKQNVKFRNICSIVLGCIIGALTNGFIVKYGPLLIPNPPGYSYATIELFKSTIHLLQPIHYLVPFTAHAVGTLVGSVVACKIALSSHKILSYLVATLFFLGSLYMVFALFPLSPMWFNVLDLVGAYFPMAWIAYKLALKAN